jgi:hypothetical protein
MCLAVIALLFITQRKALRDNTLTAKRGITPGWIIFFSVLVLELGVGYYITFVNNLVMSDAICRVAGAFYVLYIQPAHLASIGFIWPPLPSLLELPLMPLVQIYKPLATFGLAGVIVTSLFSAGTAVLIYKNCKHFKMSSWLTVLILILYTFNPFIFIYGFNGMSETIFIFFIVLTITELVQWMDDEKWTHLVWMGIALALAFLTRYESVAFAAGVFLVIGLFMIKKHRLNRQNDVAYNQDDGDGDSNGNSKHSRKSIWSYFEGTSLVVFMPFAASVILWILVNWIIMGDPLFFLTSEYSNEGQTGGSLGADMLALMGNTSAVLAFIAKKILPFISLLVIILLIRLFDKRFLKWETLMIFVIALSIPAMQYILLMIGSSYGWFRFFVYPLPIAIAWLPYEFNKLSPTKNILKTISACFCCIALIVSGLLTLLAINNSEWGSEEYSTYLSGNSGSDRAIQKEVADYINQNCSDGVLLLDSYHTWYVILSLDTTDNVITSCSYTFEDAVEYPFEYNVEYILTVDESMPSDSINKYYPDMYENGEDWCTLVKDFGVYRLYEVIY